MKRFLLFLLVFAASISLFAQTSYVTYYFERVAKVEGGVSRADTGDGHFLTFNKNIAYESDAGGISLQKGQLHYVNSNNDRPLYEGSSYLGYDVSYVFNADYSRLNVKVTGGPIYVYERKQHPVSSNMRIYETSESKYTGSSDTSDEIRRRDNRDGNSSGHSRSTRVTCPRCHGTKYVDKYIPPMSEYSIKKTEYYNCNICGKRVARNGGHGHATCPECHGVGTVIKYN